jgi:Tol biopolymer transport system component
MDRYFNLILILVLVIAGLFFLSGCRQIETSPSLTLFTLQSSEELTPKQSQVRFLLSKNENDKTLVHITTLDQEDVSTITLKNEGGKVKLSGSGSILTYRFGEYINEDFHSGIWIRDLKEKIESPVLVWPEDNSIVQLNNPDFFPNEDRIIFSVTWYETDTVGLASVKLDGSDLQVIDLPQGTLNDVPRISPDGEKILVVCEGIDVDSGNPGFMLCIMNIDGTDRSLITQNGDTHGTGFFTPDSERIIYTEYEHGGILGLFKRPYYQIRVMDVDGSNDQLILDWKYPVHILGISDDGEEIILWDEPEDGSINKILIIDIDGKNLRYLQYFNNFLSDWINNE